MASLVSLFALRRVPPRTMRVRGRKERDLRELRSVVGADMAFSYRPTGGGTKNPDRERAGFAFANPRPFSGGFNVAASRPAPITTAAGVRLARPRPARPPRR